jgi:hypothetical protein
MGLIEVIKADLLKAKDAKAEFPECFACGRTYSKGSTGIEPWGLENERFCSDKCRHSYDQGGPAYDPDYASKNNPRWYSLPMGKHGFLIDCAHCGREFDSKGLRCCSVECERGLKAKREATTIMAEVEMEPPAKRMCEAPGCSHHIPRWKNGRQVSAKVRYCSPGCRKRAGRLADRVTP